MAHGKKSRSHRSSGAAAGVTGYASAPSLRSIYSHRPVSSADGNSSMWNRRRVLLLNSTYEPLTALPMRRAIIMLICGKADVVDDDPTGLVIHSATQSVVMPLVIQLRSYVRVPYRARVPMTRAALMHRDRFCCVYCGTNADTVDHVVPRSRGGDHSWENCVACCSACNHRKGDKLLTELGWTLHRAPLPPTGQHWQLLSSLKELDPSWARYLSEGAA